MVGPDRSLLQGVAEVDGASVPCRDGGGGKEADAGPWCLSRPEHLFRVERIPAPVRQNSLSLPGSATGLV